MPRIQPYQRQNTVTSQAPSAPANVGAAGIVGNAIAGAGNALEDIAQRQAEMKKEDDFFTVQRVGKIATDYAIDFETEFKAKLEKDAYNSGEAVDDWMVKTTDKLLDIPDEKVRFQVNDHIQALGLKLKDQLAGHEAQQRKVVAENTLKGTLESASKAAYQGFGTLADNMAIINAAVANDPRMGETEKENALLAYQSGVAESYLDGIVNRNPQAAGELVKSGMFNEYLKKEQLDKFDKQIKAGATLQQGTAEADRIFALATDDTSLADMLKQLRSGEYKGKPEVMEIAENDLRSLYTARTDAKNREIAAAEKDVRGDIARIQLENRIPRSSDIAPEKWARLVKADPERVSDVLKDLRAEQEHTADRGRQSKERAEKDSADSTLTTWGSLKLNPVELAKTNLDVLYNKKKLSDQQYQNLINDQLELKTNKEEKDYVISRDTSVLKSVLAPSKIAPGSERYNKFLEAYYPRVDAHKRKTGSIPTQEEALKIARGLLAEVVQDKDWSLFDQKTTAFEANPEKVRIPDDRRKEIETLLKAEHEPVTDAAVREIYLEDLKLGAL